VIESLQALVLALASLLSAGASAADGGELQPGDARLAAIVTDPAIAEISGLAFSRRHPDLLWTHNDSGDLPQIYALDTDGKLRATVRLRGVRNIDFEDIAAFELDGRAYLLVADVGDNGGVRRELQLHVLAEPDPVDGEVEVAWTVRFRWPDGPRDCEAVAVDAAAGEVLLASKKRVPPELFRLPLRPADGSLQVAEPVGLLTHIAQPSKDDLARNPVYGRYRSQVTALDLSADGRRLAVLNYLQVYVYTRMRGEPWSRALRRRPLDVPFPWLAQAEAVAFEPDGGALWVGTERLPAPLLRLPVGPPR
jgi:hypothetical protein